MALHDFGTVRAFETNGGLELSFARGDQATLSLAKSYKGRWDPNRRVWRIDPQWAKADVPTIVAAIENSLLAKAPEAWKRALPNFSKATVTTRRYSLVLGAGGARIRLAPGHKHEYALKARDGVHLDGKEWVIPAIFCADKDIKEILSDIMRDDKAALGRMIDYMEGFALAGVLNLIDEESRKIGIELGATVFAEPSFVYKADPTLRKEDLIEFPFTVTSLERTEAGPKVTLAFLTGENAWRALRTRFGTPPDERKQPLDPRHIVDRRDAELESMNSTHVEGQLTSAKSSATHRWIRRRT